LSVADGFSTASKGTEYGQVGDEEIISTGKGRAYGIEILFKIIDINNLNLTYTYTYFRSEFTNMAGIYYPSSWDTKHLSNLTANYKLPKNCNMSIRQRFVGGAPYTPIDAALSSKKAAWDIQNQPFLDYSKFNSLRLSHSHMVDVRIDKEYYFKKWLLNLYADIQNVFNFKSESTPIYTNLDKNGQPITDPNDSSSYQLRKIESLGGSILPTIGIILKM
jgi:outer membrane receptor for ferrienterochelin and colicin